MENHDSPNAMLTTSTLHACTKVWSAKDFQLLRTLAGHEGKVCGSSPLSTCAFDGQGVSGEYKGQPKVYIFRICILNLEESLLPSRVGALHAQEQKAMATTTLSAH